MGILYLVSTPIGNLEDITIRALRILREASLIAAEDTRHTQRLLARYDIHVPTLAYHEHNKLARLDDILTALAHGDVALVSDAGTPGLSDPGFELVNACISAGFTIVPIPGPCAPIAALVASGLPTDQFLYLGFLPRRGAERRALLTHAAELPPTLVCFEAPHRIIDTLKDMLTILGDRRIVVARELTKIHEELRREQISQALEHFAQHRPRGEFTLVIAGRGSRLPHTQPASAHLPTTTAGEHPSWTTEASSTDVSEADVAARLRVLHAQGHSPSAAARQAARELRLSKSLVYQIWIALEKAPPLNEDT